MLSRYVLKTTLNCLSPITIMLIATPNMFNGIQHRVLQIPCKLVISS